MRRAKQRPSKTVKGVDHMLTARILACAEPTSHARASLAALALSLAFAPLAHAADAPATDARPAVSDNAAGTGEIIVTAFKRSESALKVPATISVLGGADLKTVGVVSVNDVQNLVPGVVIGSGSFGTVVSIRGVTSSDETSKGEIGIAFNIDGAFIGRGQEQGVAFFDIDRVEVLRGPQGTLYGRSSTGGAINVITRKPVLDTYEGYARVEIGNDNTRRIEAALNVPVTPTFALRAAVNANVRDGYLQPVTTTVTGATGTNTLNASGEPAKNDQNDRTGRFSALFRPSDSFSNTTVVTVGHIGGVGSGSALESNLEIGGDVARQIMANPLPTGNNENFVNVNDAINAKFGNVQLDVLGDYQHFSDSSNTTGNANPYDTGSATAPGEYLLDEYNGVFDTTQFEARLSNVNPGFIDYVVGANYYDETIHESDHNWKAPVDTWTDYSTWITAIDPVNTTKHKSYGIFGQATLHPTARLGVIGGLRYSNNQSSRVGTFAVNTTGECVYPDNCPGSDNSGVEKDHKVTWKVGLNYQVTPANLVYASVSTGFKAGGFNDFDPASGKAVVPYGPESITAYEIGYKGRPTAKLTLSASAYYYDYSADQINGLALFANGSAGVTGVLYTQLAPVEIYGLEGEANYQFSRDTALHLNMAYEHSKIKSLETGYLGYLTGTFANWAGYQLPNVPHFTANAALTHAIPLNNGARIKLRAASKFSSSYLLSDYANAVQFRQGAFTRTDASIGYAAQGDRLTIEFFVTNIENRLQRTFGPNGYNGAYGADTGGVPSAEANGTSYPVGSANFGVSLPRLYGVRLGTRF
jgi:iron complex outermembrane recepter protein